MRPLVLLTNDDGVHSPYLDPTARGLEDGAGVDVMIVVPERERSATSHSITLHKPLRAKELGAARFTVSGSPVDGVVLGTLELAPRPVAMVVSGINRGYNLGGDVFYSGTVAAAADAALRGIPGVAVSLAPGAEIYLDDAARFAGALVKSVLADPLPERTVLNANIPAGADGRYQWTRLGNRVYRDVVHKRVDPRGRSYYWIAGSLDEVENSPDSDCYAVEHGIISLTPLSLDLTDGDIIDRQPQRTIDGYSHVGY